MSAVLQDRPEPGTVDLTRTLPGQEALLTPAAQTFLAGLHARFEGERQARLAARRTRQAAFDAGALNPVFIQMMTPLHATSRID